jgi:hypothetical protein
MSYILPSLSSNWRVNRRGVICHGVIGLSSPVSGFWQKVMDNLVTAYPNRVEI